MLHKTFRPGVGVLCAAGRLWATRAVACCCHRPAERDATAARQAPARGVAGRGKQATCSYDGYLDLYSAGTSWQNSVTFNFPYGYHTIHVGVTGLKNSYSTDTYVDLDQLVTQ